MKKEHRTNLILKALLCAMLAIALFAVVTLPHSHRCTDADCALCLNAERLRESLCICLLTGVAVAICNVFLCAARAYTSRNQTTPYTPIKLKVKLSD